MIRRDGLCNHFLQQPVGAGKVGAGSGAEILVFPRASVQSFVQIADRVPPVAVDPFIVPETDDVKNLFPGDRVFPVEVRLLFGKKVKIILTPLRHILPRAAAEHRFPVIRCAAVRRRVPPDIKVCVRVVSGFFRLDKPPMPVRGVVQHQVHDNGNTPGMCAVPESLPVGHAAKLLRNRFIIRNIIAVVHTGGRIDRGHPDRVNPQFGQIIQLFGHAFQVADPVPVRVLKTARVNLIDDQIFIPVFFMLHAVHPFLGSAYIIRQFLGRCNRKTYHILFYPKTI